MVKIQKHIEIARTTVPGLSSMSQKSCDALLILLKKHYETVNISYVNSLKDLEILVSKQPDLVFMGLKYLLDENNSKIWVSGYLARHNITHTGSPQQAIELEQDKSLAKIRMQAQGVTTSAFMLIKNVKDLKTDLPFGYPMFVKPSGLGAGQGIDENSIVHNRAQLVYKLQSIFDNFKSNALVENYLPGREFSVAVLRDEQSRKYIGMPLELLPGADSNGDHMLSYRLKSGALETPVTSVTEVPLRNRLISLALQAFNALEARDYGRIDIRLDANGDPHFLEANLIPCIIEGSGNFPKACVINQNMGYEEMILRIVQLGLTRLSTNNESPVTSVLHSLFTTPSIVNA